MTDTILHPVSRIINSKSAIDTVTTLAALAAHTHRAPPGVAIWRHWWTPEDKQSLWLPAGVPFVLPARLRNGHSCYFTVNPTNKRRKNSQASINADVAAINALLMEIDGKDFVEPHEWQPHYTTPALEGMDKAHARGALQKAQTAAIDAAYKAKPAEYKARALAHVLGLAVRPSVAWDSGGGYQMLWLLRETVPIDDSNRAAVAHVQREWVHLMGGDPAASDLRRVLRVPGSFNRKPKYAPNYPEVTFLWADLDLQYDYAELAALVPAKPTPTQRKAVHMPAGVALDLAINAELPTLPQHEAVTAYNRATNLRDLLISYGYSESTHNPDRLSRPGADSDGLQLHPNNTATIYSSGDPLYGARCTPALAYCVYEHGGDVDATMDALTGGEWTTKPRKATPEQWAAAKEWLYRGGAEATLRAVGVKRVDGYLKTLGAMLDHAEKRGGFTTIAPGMRSLAEAACTGVGTLSRHMATLFAGKLIGLKMGDAGTMTATRIDLDFVYRAQPEQVYSTPKDTCSTYERYRNYSRDDAFQGGYRQAWGTAWHLAQTTLKPLPASAAAVWAALADAGEMNRRELAEELGTTFSRVATATRRMLELGLLEVEKVGRARVYGLTAAAVDLLNEARPKMHSYGLAARRRYQSLQYSLRQAGKNRNERKEERLRQRMKALAAKALDNGLDLAARGAPAVTRKRIDTDLGKVKSGEAQRLVDHALLRRAAIRQAWIEREDALKAMDDDYWQRTMSAPPAMELVGAWAAD